MARYDFASQHSLNLAKAEAFRFNPFVPASILCILVKKNERIILRIHTKLFQTLAFLLSGLGLSLAGYGQMYSYSGPISGNFEMFLKNGSNADPSSVYVGGTVCSFSTLNETVYLDQAAGTIRQVGFISVTPSSGTWVLDDSRTVQGLSIPATLTINLAVTGAGMSFDTGPQTYVPENNIFDISGTSGSPGIPPIAFNGSYSWTTGGQTYTNSFNYQLEFGFSLYNRFSIADLTSLTLSSPYTSGGASGKFVAGTNAANGLALTLVTGGRDNNSLARWTGSITATIVTNFIVTNTNDSGAGSLRQAIAYANASGGGSISFSKAAQFFCL